MLLPIKYDGISHMPKSEEQLLKSADIYLDSDLTVTFIG